MVERSWFCIDTMELLAKFTHLQESWKIFSCKCHNTARYLYAAYGW